MTVFCSPSASGQSRSSTPSTLACDPATCPIIPGCETTIDISKGRTGLGLSIVGGCDTLLVENEKYECESACEAAADSPNGWCMETVEDHLNKL